MNQEFPVKNWKWIFYIYAWFWAATPVFWLIVALAYYTWDRPKPFFGNHFHARVWKLGILFLLVTIVLVALSYYTPFYY